MDKQKQATDALPSPRELIHALIHTNLIHRRKIGQRACSIGLHRSQHIMLMYLSECDEVHSQKHLAEHLGISSAAVTSTIKKLEADGYLERKKNSDSDSRNNGIYITELGRKVAMESKKYFDFVDKTAFDGFTDQEIEIFYSLTCRIQDNLTNIDDIVPLEEQTRAGKENQK